MDCRRQSTLTQVFLYQTQTFVHNLQKRIQSDLDLYVRLDVVRFRRI